jgi:hypothetical protein
MPAYRPRRPGFRFAAVLAGLALAAGAAAGERAPADPGEFRYEPLSVDGTLETSIDAATAVFEFKTGRSAFRAFRLPALDRPYLIEVQSLLSGGTDAARGRVFYPVAALLNDDFMVSRQTDLDALRFDLPVFENARAPAYRLSIGVDPAQGKERYLVVFTPAALLSARPADDATTPEEAAKAAHEAFPGAAAGGVLRITVRTDTGPR